MDYTGDLHSVIFNEVQSEVANHPEKQLVLAVMTRAILDVCGSVGATQRFRDGSGEYERQCRRIQKEAYKWMFFGRRHDQGLTFVFCCEVLNLCPDSVRARIRSFARHPDDLRHRVWRLKDAGMRSYKRINVCRPLKIRDAN